ncbi:hypothetical protein ZWY2020_000860 [Hordeum vulgare]|nr:hypothetical protein ZWY2020_000860 [Hordeum vulgare]
MPIRARVTPTVRSPAPLPSPVSLPLPSFHFSPDSPNFYCPRPGLPKSGALPSASPRLGFRPIDPRRPSSSRAASPAAPPLDRILPLAAGTARESERERGDRPLPPRRLELDPSPPRTAGRGRRPGRAGRGAASGAG